jgi:hypothetical protein
MKIEQTSLNVSEKNKSSFTKANRYLFDPSAYAWNIPSGWTCPAAEQCLAKADRYTGKITNGAAQKFKCYSAMTERYPSVRKRLWSNFEAVVKKSPDEVCKELQCLPAKVRLVRIHASGDFFSQNYFDGWLQFIRSKPDVHFWAFTKSLPFWILRMDEIPSNFVLQASYGGKHDSLIQQHGLKYARVVWSKEEAERLDLPIDTDDRLAAYGTRSFALLENFTKSK